MQAAGPSDAAVKIRIVEGRPMVDNVYLNHSGPYRFLLDTGTTLNHLDPRLTKSIGLKSTFSTDLLTSIGTVALEGAGGIDVTLGPVRADAQTFLFGGLDNIRRSFPDVQGVLGQEFLSRFDYRLNLRGRRLEFGTPKRAAKESRVPFQTVAGRPTVFTSLGSLVLDSGADGVILFGGHAMTLTHEMFTMTGSLRVGTMPGTLVIDGRTWWRGKAVVIPRSAEVGTEGLLPLSLFNAVYVCNSAGYLVLD
jgi:Aspartyl protease